MQTALLMKALADDTRLRTFRALAEAGVGLCVAEMTDILQKPQYAVSRSFIELRKAGLLKEERRGKFVYYSLANDAPVADLGTWAIRYCECADTETKRNRDGSSTPGSPVCHYDSERLRWRLSLREPAKTPITRGSVENVDGRPRILFVCVHNSARSQLAEEYLRQMAGHQFFVNSAGLRPGTLNPHVIAILNEEGIDISQKQTLAVGDLYRNGETYQWVITVCSREAEEHCPVFPGPVRRLSWPFADPSTFVGTEHEIREQVRVLAAEIKAQVKTFVEDRKKEIS